jgi:hypothetical protein
MSEKQDDILGQEDKTILVSAEDCNAALDFWRHFNIEIPSALQDAVTSFEKDATFENQQKVKLEFCKAIAETDHEAFKDEMFSKIREECADTTFNMQFDKDLESTLSVDKTETEDKK